MSCSVAGASPLRPGPRARRTCCPSRATPAPRARPPRTRPGRGPRRRRAAKYHPVSDDVNASAPAPPRPDGRDARRPAARPGRERRWRRAHRRTRGRPTTATTPPRAGRAAPARRPRRPARRGRGRRPAAPSRRALRGAGDLRCRPSVARGARPVLAPATAASAGAAEPDQHGRAEADRAVRRRALSHRRAAGRSRRSRCGRRCGRPGPPGRP